MTNEIPETINGGTPDDLPEFRDKLMVCVDCGSDFVWERGEQEYFWSKGLADPKRCSKCRVHRRLTIRSRMGG